VEKEIMRDATAGGGPVTTAEKREREEKDKARAVEAERERQQEQEAPDDAKTDAGEAAAERAQERAQEEEEQAQAQQGKQRRHSSDPPAAPVGLASSPLREGKRPPPLLLRLPSNTSTGSG
jgi:hypothetical protein